MRFERHLAVDWSGAGTDGQRNRGLALADAAGVVAPPAYTTWSRVEVEAQLAEVLRADAPRTIVAIDAALSYPFGFGEAVFGRSSWREMVDGFGALRREHETARAIAHAINGRFASGPFRFNESRNDHRFYREHAVAYFRAVELAMPQCISPFYLGSGASVGFHAITALGCMSRLLARRDAGELDFAVWPFEGHSARHLVCECYPSMFPRRHEPGVTDHERDAIAVADWMAQADSTGELESALTPWRPAFGQRTDVGWDEQLAFEGWVLGV